MEQVQDSDEEEQPVGRENSDPGSPYVDEDAVAFLPMSILRALLREELHVFAETGLKSLLTAELGKHGPARDPPIRSSAVDTAQGQPVPVDVSAEPVGGELEEELVPNCVPQLLDLRRPAREFLPDVSGHWEAAVMHRCETRVQVLAKPRVSWPERLVEDASRGINSLSDDLDRQCSCPLVEQLERSALFNFLAGFVIVANSAVMALAAEYEIQHIEDPYNQTYIMVELCFVIAYTVEWLIRAWSGRCRFLGTGWCWFDLCILLGGWLEVGGGNSYVTQFRIMRTLKMLKVMRIVRLMRSLSEVRVLVVSLMGSVRPLFWASLIIAMLTYMFAILFVNSVAAYLSDQFDSGYSDIDTTDRTSLLDSWGSVPKSMYTLFSCVSGGEDWRAPASLLAKVGSDAFAYFLSYVIFFMFAISNSVCAFFVDAFTCHMNSDHAQVQQDRLYKKRKYVDAMTATFRDLANGRGHITKADVMVMMEEKRMAKFLAELDIDSLDLNNFFDRLSVQGQKAVDVELFVEGCIRLCGHARSMDMLELLTQNETLCTEMRTIRIAMEDAGMLRVSPDTAHRLR